MGIVPIEDPQDPRISAYRAVRERDVVGRGERFVAEGEVVLRLLLQQRRFGVESILIAAHRVEREGALIALVPPGVPIYAAAQPVMDAVVGFSIHRGMLAIGLRPPMPAPQALLAGLPERALVVGCVGIANHDNMGGIFRNAAAFGASAVLADETSVDPLYRKAIRVSVGAALTVPFARAGSGHAMLDALAAAGFTAFALTPSARLEIDAVPVPARAALILGAEGPGLPDDIIARAQGLRIGMAPGFDSLNVATAAGIALHHFRMR